MSQILRAMRFYWWLLGLFTVGRWALSLSGAEYEKTHQVFSLVTLTLIAAAHHAAFARAFLGWRAGQAAKLGFAIAFATQLVILLSTAISYLAGLETHFNAPRALNVEQAIPMAQAMTARVIGLVVNSILGTLAALIGYAMGGALPRRDELA